ncbi:16S rRNA (uracil(1498)-N(3))-methyltransferase [Fastidiosibacter lacustris]|uniref:16S rRNA (uracil(1498)-N(3))-methyltransferase n=1 Tax=Fastidiosibacter lacustris TaxID=2056695 RepID=UPI0013004139|nr:16S rRNA (uracil(1498)-N(3))-methyltransferase [Fastidiosibacter lacustris]
MRVARIFCPEVVMHSNTFSLSTELSHYLIKVLRHKVKHKVILFNNDDGYEYLAEICDANPKSVTVNISTKYLIERESILDIHLFQSLSKGDKLETVIQKATELGVKHITPIITQRVDYKLSLERINTKLEHWQKIAISASEQSGRVFIPKINPPIIFSQALNLTVELKLLLSPYAIHHVQALKQQYPKVSQFNIYIGPEGGFSEDELKLASHHDCQSIALGQRILRTETAPIATIAILQALWGDFNK